MRLRYLAATLHATSALLQHHRNYASRFVPSRHSLSGHNHTLASPLLSQIFCHHISYSPEFVLWRSTPQYVSFPIRAQSGPSQHTHLQLTGKCRISPTSLFQIRFKRDPSVRRYIPQCPLYKPLLHHAVSAQTSHYYRQFAMTLSTSFIAIHIKFM